MSLPVLLSAGVPDEVAGTPKAQRVYDFVSTIVAALFDAGLHLVFGGHPTITPLVYRVANSRADQRSTISLYQLERFREQAPPETFDARVFDRVHWVGMPELTLDKDFANLRDPMTRLARAAIFVGGKTTGFMGSKPGTRDEFERFRTYHAAGPVYLVGGAGGEAARLIDAAAGADQEKNGLVGKARHLLHVSHDPRLVTALIARDLKQRVHLHTNSGNKNDESRDSFYLTQRHQATKEDKDERETTAVTASSLSRK